MVHDDAVVCSLGHDVALIQGVDLPSYTQHEPINKKKEGEDIQRVVTQPSYFLRVRRGKIDAHPIGLAESLEAHSLHHTDQSI